MILEPNTIQTLLERANALQGMSLIELAWQCGYSKIADLKRHKGFVGELLEQALGASSGCKPQPDFPAFGVELKTIPVVASKAFQDLTRRPPHRAAPCRKASISSEVNEHRSLKGGEYRPKESTFVSIIPLMTIQQETWKTSVVYQKLKKVLWIPIVSDLPSSTLLSSSVLLKTRWIGTPTLWSPSVDQEAILRADWEEVADMIVMGELEQISARQGTYLQVRPKGANAKSLVWAIGAAGHKIQTLPRGFYLRSQFTKQILT